MKSDRSTCAGISALLPAHAGATLDAARTARVERHVAGCRACQAELAELGGLLAELRGLPPGPPRSDASWSDFSRSLRLSWQRSLDEAEARRAGGPRRWLLRLCFGAGTAMALGTAALLLLPRLQPAATAPHASPAVSTMPSPRARSSTAAGDDAARLEAAGRVSDVLGDADPDELLDGLDDHQLEQLGKALAPGA